MNTGADLTVIENEVVPRPEEERITQAEKNKRMQEQLKVRGLQPMCCLGAWVPGAPLAGCVILQGSQKIGTMLFEICYCSQEGMLDECFTYGVFTKVTGSIVQVC